MKNKNVSKSPIPESYKSGIAFIEGLTVREAIPWLHKELREEVHMLAGGSDDFPVQAIINHYRYLSFLAQAVVRDAIEGLICQWRNELERHERKTWSESAVIALLNLTSALHVSHAKYGLQSLVNSPVFLKMRGCHLQPSILLTVVVLSANSDRHFWTTTAQRCPKYAGMAFQVLTRIAPSDALCLLEQFPDSKHAVGSVARRLPDFVSEQPFEKQKKIMERVTKAISRLSRTSANVLLVSLSEAGFDV